jgi:hypothetical protein
MRAGYECRLISDCMSEQCPTDLEVRSYRDYDYLCYVVMGPIGTSSH